MAEPPTPWVRARARADAAVAVAFAAVVTVRFAYFALLHLWSLAAGREGLAAAVRGGDDGDYYYRAAQDVAAGWDASLANGYPLLLGTLMRLTGVREIFLYKSINFVLGILLIAVALRLRTLLDGDEVGVDGRPTARSRIALVALVGLYPSTMNFALGSLYRDGWIYLLHPTAVLLVVLAVRARGRRERFGWAVLAAVALAALGVFRWYGPLSVALGLGGWAAFAWLRRRIGPARAAGVLAVGAGAGLAVLVLASTAALPMLTGGVLTSERLLALLEYRSGYEETGAQSNLGVDFTRASLATAPALFVYSFVSNAIGPLPTQVRSAATAIGFISEVPILAYVGAQLWRNRRLRDPAVSLVVWQALAWFALIAFFNDNLGTAFRLRVLGWNCLLVAYAVLSARARRTEGAVGA